MTRPHRMHASTTQRRHRRGLAVIVLAAAIAISTAAQDFGSASESAFADVQKATADLADLRRQIANEKIPLSQELTRLENEIIRKRREEQRAAIQRDSQQLDLRTLENEVKERRTSNDALGAFLADYIRDFETRLHPAEVQTYRDEADAALNSASDPNLTAEEKFSAQLAIIRTALDRLERTIGGEPYAGDALVAGRVVKPGRFAQVGPVAVFNSDDGAFGGLATIEVNSDLPVIVDLGSRFAAEIAALAKSGKGSLPVDPSMGNALRLEETRDTLVEHIRKGGITMVPLLLLAAATLIVAVFKFFDILAVQRPDAATLHAVLDQLNKGDDEAAARTVAGLRGPFGDLLAAAVKNAREDKEYVDEVLYERMLVAQPRLERFLAFIALAAASAPLLGLLGTVVGIIDTFRRITVFGTGDAKNFAPGISEALITTEYGLYIAIAALLAHALLSRLARLKLAGLEQISVAILNGLGRKGR